MGSLATRVSALEDRSRERATEQVREAWYQLTDREMALIVAPFRYGRQPTPREVVAWEAFSEELPEDLIARAVGLEAQTDKAERRRRMTRLVAPILERRSTPELLRELERLEGGEPWEDL
jgi:hypothetical protein